MERSDPGFEERLAQLISSALLAQVGSARRRDELLAEAYVACREALGENPTPSVDEEELAGRLAPVIAEVAQRRSESEVGTSARSGVWRAYLGPDFRPVEDPQNWFVAEASPEQAVSSSALADAFARAKREGNQTLLRYLDWLDQRNHGMSYEAIAAEAGYRPTGIRTGVRRARREVRRLAQEIRRAAHAPHGGGCPAPLERARDAWSQHDLPLLHSELDATREELGEHPYWRYLNALSKDDRGDREAAVALFEKILVDDDDHRLRAKVLNCLGYIADDAGNLDGARSYWSRSIQMDPRHLPAQINLLKNSCDRKDALDVLVCIDRIGDLLSSSTLSGREKEYLIVRLDEHPDFGWARSLDAWHKGPRRWIFRYRRPRAEGERRGSVSGVAGLALSVVAVLGLGLSSLPAGEIALHQGNDLLRTGAVPFETANSGDRGGARKERGTVILGDRAPAAPASLPA